MIKKILSLLAVVSYMGCARVQTLNLEKYNYAERPHHIIWFQIAGFSEEHIPLLRFNVPETTYRTSIEKVNCLGKMWSYNLYDLRPNSSASFLSQLSGSKNIKGQCTDYEVKPVWDLISELGYFSSIFESGASQEQTLEQALKCTSSNSLDLKKIRYYKMGGDNGADISAEKKLFHYQDTTSAIQEVMDPGVYYDKSCQKNVCYSSLSNNLRTLWGQVIKEQSKSFFLVRDFNYLKALKNKDIGHAKETILEIERVMSWIKSQKRDDVLILITGAESLNLEFPKEGKEWADFERSGKNLIFKNSSLMSPVLASGPMSENFCGLFDESEMLKRIMHRPEKRKFDWKLLSPL